MSPFASYTHLSVSDSETESDDNLHKISVAGQRKRNQTGLTTNPRNLQKNKNEKGKKVLSAEESNKAPKPLKSKSDVDQDALVELAKKYQKHMQIMATPKARLATGRVMSWQGFTKTLKGLYGQPLHYLTHMLCKEFDKSRTYNEDEETKPLDAAIMLGSAESTIWSVEEVHRRCTSPSYLAMLWHQDPEYRFFVDQVIPPT